MSSRRKFSMKDEVVDLVLSQQELDYRSGQAVIRHLMEVRPRCVPSLINCLATQGYDSTEQALKLQKDSMEINRPKSPAAAAQEKRLASLRENAHEAVQPRASQEGTADWIPNQYDNLESFSVQIIFQHILVIAEKHTLSAANLRSSKVKHPECGTKEALLHCVEFITGWGRDYQLVGPYRYWPFFETMVSFRSLPPRWPIDGIYSVCVEKGSVYVVHLFTKSTYPLDASVLPAFNEPDYLWVDQNYSEKRASVRSLVDPTHDGILMANACTDHVVNKRLVAPKPYPIALQNPILPMKAIEYQDSSSPAKKLKGHLGWGRG